MGYVGLYESIAFPEKGVIIHVKSPRGKGWQFAYNALGRQCIVIMEYITVST